MRSSLIVVLVALVALPGLALAEKKIALVDPIEAIRKSDEVEASQLQMKSSLGDERQKLQQLQKEIQQISKKLEKEGMTLSKEKKQNLQDKRQSKMIEARQVQKLVRKRMRGEQQQILKRMRPKVMKAVEEIARDKGYDLVLNVQAVMYAGEGLDITSQVINKLNATGSSKK